MATATPPKTPMTTDKAQEAVKHVIGTVLGFTPIDSCPLWLALKNDMTDKSHVGIYNNWLWMTQEGVNALEYLPDPKKPKVFLHHHMGTMFASPDSL
jgi:hypothetical protein